MNSCMEPESKTQKTILIAAIVVLLFLALAEGMLLLRSAREKQADADYFHLHSVFPPQYNKQAKAQQVLGDEENLMLQETAEDLERLHAQINRLFNHDAHFSSFDNPQRLQSEIERIFQNAREGRHGAALNLLEKDWRNVSTISSLNIQENETNYVVAISMPGFEKHEINIDIRGRILAVGAEKKGKGSAGDKQAAIGGHFTTQIMLPADTKGEAAQASYQDGVLKITVQKTPAANSLAHNVPIM